MFGDALVIKLSLTTFGKDIDETSKLLEIAIRLVDDGCCILELQPRLWGQSAWING